MNDEIFTTRELFFLYTGLTVLTAASGYITLTLSAAIMTGIAQTLYQRKVKNDRV